MRHLLSVTLGILLCASAASSQTADELVAKNTLAKGGIEKIKAIKTLRMSGRLQAGSFTAQVTAEQKAPNMLRQSITIQGMTQIQAYDGSSGWQISPFEGRKDPELLGEDDLRPLVDESDFYGPLIDPKTKGITIEYLGHDTVDGDDAYRLKITLKNGDILYYYLDPDTYLEIRIERQMFIRGSVRESVTDLGSYKQVNGVYFPFSANSHPKQSAGGGAKVTFETIEANITLNDSEFRMPQAPAVPSPQKHPEPPAPGAQPPKPPKPPEKGGQR